MLSSVVILGEDLALSSILGAAAVIAGLWLIQRPASTLRQAATAPAANAAR